MECSKCSIHIQDDDKYIQCDSCRTPFHLNEKCSGLCPSEIKAIVVQRRVIFFFCEECKSSFKKVPHLLTKLSVLENDISLLKQEVKDTKKKHCGELSLLKRELNDLKSITGAGMENILTEVHERAIRSNNLMLFNVEESKSESLEAKIADDKKIAIQVLESIGVESNDLTKVIRIGRQGNKPRPIKMILSNSNAVGYALRLKNRLLNTKFRIASDKTKLQQEQMKKVQDELKQRRDRGEPNLSIKYRKGIPVIEESKN
ncbi:hypothetical protein JTB14_014232 [Gonioctena quinquepunctata]|nr:hypothetical protein JTB14_014232 [Gonioctena quinquepunctata]